MTQKLETKKVDGLQLIDENCAAVEAIDKLIAYGNEALSTVSGIKKAIMSANFVCQMQAALSPEVMGAIMALQDTGIGFRTDRADKGGYPLEVVRGCLIEAAALGLGAVGNQFNIISGRTYVTKEGAGQLLKNLKVRHWESCLMPEIGNGSAKARVIVEWYDDDGKHEERLEFLVRVNSGMGADAVNGKAVRKARMWLYGRITGMELSDGDADDAREPVDVTPKRSVFAPRENPPEPIVEQQAQPLDVSPIAAKLEELKVTDITVDDIVEFHRAKEINMNVSYICGKIVAVVNAVRAWKKEAQNG